MINIMLVEPNRDNLMHLSLILKVADIHFSSARTLDELMNWINASRLGLVSFDLLLFHNLPHTYKQQTLDSILEILTIPIVFVDRGRGGLDCSANQSLVICKPDEILSCIRNLIENHNRSGNINPAVCEMPSQHPSEGM